MRLTAPRLARIRSIFALDGQFAQFYVLNTKGAHVSFTIAFAELGLLMSTFKNAARELQKRLDAHGHASSAQVAEGLAAAAPVVAVAMAKDADTGDALLWLETAENGATAVRLDNDMLATLEAALSQHRAEREYRDAAQ